MDISDDRVQAILNEYETRIEAFNGLNETCVRLINDLLRGKGIEVHTVTGRVKAKDTLALKLAKKPYASLEEVTDVVGIRVITHFEKEVEDISHLIEKEFTVDRENSVDKRKILAPDSFGYLSLHYVCSLSEGRLQLAEYESFRGFKFEIQLRSILQHAWAEIEHDLGYKRGQGVPDRIRRRFSRLAGLLEIADEEFGAIRAELGQYESSVRNEVGTSLEDAGIDNITLKIAFDKEIVHEIDDELAKSVDVRLIEEADDTVLPILSAGLPLVGVTTVAQLLDKLEQHREMLVYQATARFKDKGSPNLKRGSSVLQLLWVLMGLDGEEQGILSGIAKIGLAGGQPDEEFARDVVARIREFREVKRQPRPRGRSSRTQSTAG